MTVTLDRARSAFAESFGGAPALVARAPGRVNLIGEHTDYNDGFVLPAAITGQSLVAVRAREDRIITAVAADFGNAVVRFSLDAPFAHDADAPWADYLRGMVLAMEAACHRLTGAELAIAGDVPRGAGLSSSASFAVAIGVAMKELSGVTELDATGIAQLAQAAECDFVGMRCGIMDQLISARGKAGHALLIDCRTLACRPVSLPDGVAILIVHSGIERGLVEGEYNARRAQCEDAVRVLGVPALRDATVEMLAAAADRLTPLALKRARHVVTENARTEAAAEALSAGDLVALGALMAQSHASMRDDFEITLPAIDALVALLQEAIGPEGGARMTGGGFGGAVVAIVPRDRLDDVIKAVRTGYRTPKGGEPLILVETPSEGASLIG